MTGQTLAAPHRGMPPLDTSGPPLSVYEFWPMQVFYLPIFAHLAWLMLRHRSLTLPTAANPSFPDGGLVGEEKSEILRLLNEAVPDWVAPFVRVDRPATGGAPEREAADALAALRAAGLDLPVVAKPDLGCRGVGVRLIRTIDDLVRYVAGFPAGASIVLQRYIPHEGEAGVFYVRRPGEAAGRIISLTLKYFPHVVGDGRTTLKDLILADPRAGRLPHLYLHRHAERLDWVVPCGQPVRLAFAGSHSRGTIFRDGTHLVTPALVERFDAIAKAIPEFWFGRFDVRFDSFAEVQAGRGFTIVELNGAGAESTHIWDRRTPLLRAWADLFRQNALLFEVGAANRARGFAPAGLRSFWRRYRREKALTPQYPSTD
jgi:hypothetical protein